MILPRVRGRFALERERDLEERILSFDPEILAFDRAPSPLWRK
jgi:hypothetical protein